MYFKKPRIRENNILEQKKKKNRGTANPSIVIVNFMITMYAPSIRLSRDLSEAEMHHLYMYFVIILNNITFYKKILAAIPTTKYTVKLLTT